MTCPLCLADRAPAVRIEQWIVCEECQRALAIDSAASYLREGNLDEARRCISEPQTV